MDLENREWYHRSAGVKTTGKKIANKKKKKINVHMLNLDTVLQPMGNVFFFFTQPNAVLLILRQAFFLAKVWALEGQNCFAI